MNRFKASRLLQPRSKKKLPTRNYPTLLSLRVSSNRHAPKAQQPPLHASVFRALVRIQSLVRMFLVRCRFVKYLRFYIAALTIQSVYRGYQVRKTLSFKKPKRCPDSLLVVNAVLPEIRALRLELYEIARQQRDLQELSAKYEKAFRYLFEQVGKVTKSDQP